MTARKPTRPPRAGPLGAGTVVPRPRAERPTPAGTGLVPRQQRVPAGPELPLAAAEGAAARGLQTPGVRGPRTTDSRAPGHHMTERDLENGVRRILADLPSVLAYHTHDSRKSASGWPDWCFCGPRGLLFRELKREGKKPTRAQEAWLAALRAAGQSADTWYPADLLDGTIARELAALAGLGRAP
jgi:hypothetical protein